MAKRACDHCHLEFDEGQLIKDMINGEERYFCCKGCQGVFHLLHEEGLDSFYEKAKDTKLDPVSIDLEDLDRFDREGFRKRYVTTKDGFSQISLIIEGIHCSACVWLNEKVLHQSEGIIEAEINFTTHKARIVWDEDEISLSQIIQKIRSIGYNAYPYDASLQEERAEKARKGYYARLLVGIFATMNVMWLAIAQYAGYFTGMSEAHKKILQGAEFVLATPTLFYTGWVYFRGAYYGLKNRFINMDFLVATGATLTYLYSIYAMVTGKGETYFESTIMIITFVFVGKYLEVLSKRRAVDTLDHLTGSLPTEVTVLQEGEKRAVSVENIQEGDLIEVRAGEKIVIDGRIESGEGSFDESSLSGESRPVWKQVGDEVISGSINNDGVIRYRATKRYGDSMIANIVSLLETSLSKKPHIEKLANQISGYFSVAILTIALITFFAWMGLGHGFERSLIVAISVIVIACPCALGLATPMATLVGIGTASKRGILFKEAGYLESFAKCDTLVLDKTGTLTEGKLEVVKLQQEEGFDPDLIYSLVKSSTHPVSQGVARYLESHFIPKERALEGVQEIKARGLRVECENHTIIAGNASLMQEEGIVLPNLEAMSHFIVAIDKCVVAIFYLEDRIKTDAKEVLEQFRKDGMQIMMLTGDNREVAQKIADALGIDRFYAGLMPLEKSSFIDKLHNEGHRVVMVGDGVNDAVSLAKSDIAIAMGSGADVSVEVSDVVLLNDSMHALYEAYRISRTTFRNIKENLVLSLIYNLITVPLAVLGYVIPLVAALSMSLSSLLVVANALRIRRSI